MTRAIRNTGPCFPSVLTPSKRPKRHVESYRSLYAHILHALILQAIPFELPRKPPTVNRWDPTLGNPGGDKYYNQYRPQCEVCPRDHGKVLETLRGDLLAVRQTIYVTDYTTILRTHGDLVIKDEYKSTGRALIYEPTTVESIKQSPMRT